MDKKSAFLNGYIEEEVYVGTWQDFEVQGKDDNIYKLKKTRGNGPYIKDRENDERCDFNI